MFRSPAVHTPQEGRDTVVGYLTAAFTVLGPELTYEREWLGADSAVLQFRTVVGGLDVSGVDIITWDDEGLIVDFTVMVRPAKALDAVIEHMGAELLRMLGGGRPPLTPHPEPQTQKPRPPPYQSPKCSRYDDAGPREPR